MRTIFCRACLMMYAIFIIIVYVRKTCKNIHYTLENVYCCINYMLEINRLILLIEPRTH